MMQYELIVIAPEQICNATQDVTAYCVCTLLQNTSISVFIFLICPVDWFQTQFCVS